jgi:hypothetical protein
VSRSSDFGQLSLEFFVTLCRRLCRNPAIPTFVAKAHSGSLRLIREALETRQTRINIASSYHSDFFSVAPSRTGSKLGHAIPRTSEPRAAFSSLPDRETWPTLLNWVKPL